MAILQFVHKTSMQILKLIFRFVAFIVPVEDTEVLFMAFHGRGLLDNPMAVYKAMLSKKEFDKYTIIWVVNDMKAELKRGTKVKYQSLGYFYHLARSKYWVINCKLPEYVHKKREQVYVQTWHGTPLKRLGMDIVNGTEKKRSRSGRSLEKIGRSYQIDSRRYTYMISPNSFSTEVFQSAFGVKRTQIVEMGYPRNDVLYKPSVDRIAVLRKKYCIPEGKQVLLYAPTWRDNDFDISGYILNLQVDFQRWKRILTDYVVLLKPHYFIVNQIKVDASLREFVRIMPPKSDINELYLISNCMVTDYSSVFFDYALLNRPIYFYMYDLEKYREELRGFYLDIYTELPGDVFVEEGQLLKAVEDKIFDYDRLRQFNQRFNFYQTGKCSDELLNLVFDKRTQKNEI